MRFILAILIVGLTSCSSTDLIIHSSSGVDASLEAVIVENLGRDNESQFPEGYSRYRMYVDLKDDYRLQAVYGNEAHPMEIGATDTLWNHEDGKDLAASFRIRDSIVIDSDSWLTLGALASGWMAIPSDQSKVGRIEAPTQDILASGVDLYMYDDEPKAPGLKVNNGAWLCLDGLHGPDEQNVICIAQLISRGVPKYRLNLQLVDSAGNVERWVHSSPAKDEFEESILLSDVLKSVE